MSFETATYIKALAERFNLSPRAMAEIELLTTTLPERSVIPFLTILAIVLQEVSSRRDG